MTFPIYYKYPGDGYNNWRIIVRTDNNTFIGTTRVYPNGAVLDGVTTCFTAKDAEGWQVLSIEEASR
jgi:hypothetical protein